MREKYAKIWIGSLNTESTGLMYLNSLAAITFAFASNVIDSHSTNLSRITFATD